MLIYRMLKKEEIIQVGKDKSRPRWFMSYYDVYTCKNEILKKWSN
jgi:hypothetical protein